MSVKSEYSHVVLESVTYEEDADIEYDGERVANHDELVNTGQAYYEARAVDPDAVGPIPDHMIVTPEDEDWREEYDDLEINDAIRIDD